MGPISGEPIDGKKLLHMFLDLCNYWDELAKSGGEEEALALLGLLEKMRQKWQQATLDNAGLRQIVSTCEADNGAMRQQMKAAKDQLRDARAQIASLVSAKQSVESDCALLERQLDVVRDVLHDGIDALHFDKQQQLAFLRERPPTRAAPPRVASFSMVDDDKDIDYDRTGDSANHRWPLSPPDSAVDSRFSTASEEDAAETKLRSGRRWQRSSSVGKKRSRSNPKTRLQFQSPIVEEEDLRPSKRSKEAPVDEIVATTTLTVPRDGGDANANFSVKRRSLNRSFSEPFLAAAPSAPVASAAVTPRDLLKSVGDLRSPAVRSWTGGEPLTSRRHIFLAKTALMPEYCDVCSKRVMFGRGLVKCQDCRFTCHTDCRERAPLPCVPRNLTPQKVAARGRLVDYTPALPPMIPHIIIHCVAELERRGLDSQGIYRLTGSERQTSDLLNSFVNSRGVPNLRHLDDAVLTSCIKKFLMSLNEPLVPTTSWHEFVHAADQMTADDAAGAAAMKRAVAELPMPQRDTLSYLMAHWLKVAEASEFNCMPASNLARVLAPTIVGNSRVNPDAQLQVDEMHVQAKVLGQLFRLPYRYWIENVAYDSQPLIGAVGSPLTPDPNMTTSLGPVIASNATPRSAAAAAAAAYSTRAASARKRDRFFQPVWK